MPHGPHTFEGEHYFAIKIKNLKGDRFMKGKTDEKSERVIDVGLLLTDKLPLPVPLPPVVTLFLPLPPDGVGDVGDTES